MNNLHNETNAERLKRLLGVNEKEMSLHESLDTSNRVRENSSKIRERSLNALDDDGFDI